MDKQVIDFLKGKGLKVIEENIDEKLEIWDAWYKGHVDKFHTYKEYSGKKKIEKKRRTLNMAARVCQNWADLLLNERVEVNVSDEYTQLKLNDLLKQVNFYVRANNLIEAAFALGGGAFTQYWDGKKVNQKYITQSMIYPISYDSGNITEAAFASEKTIKAKTYVYLETHTTDENGQYVIENYLLEKSNNSLSEVTEEFYEELELEREIFTQSEKPSFQFIRPNIANRDKFDSPYGTSVFSGATDILEAVDIAFDGYVNEIRLGRRRIFAQDGATKIHFDEKTGEAIHAFEPDDDVFYLLPEQDGKNDPPVIEVCSSLRTGEFDTALQTQLNNLSEACGFGSNGFKWDSGNVTTATQVISENSDMFRTLKKHEGVLRPAIIDMAYSLLNFEAIYNGDTQIDLTATITVDFDDSIIEDTAEIKRQAMLELNTGLIDPVEYYIQVYKLDEEQALAFFEKMQARMPQPEEEPPEDEE